MKKLIVVALILFTQVWATNAQQLNSIQPQNERAGDEVTAGKMNLNTNQILPVKNELHLDPAPVHDKAYYLKKSRDNKTASICLMAGGGILLGIGALTFPKDYDIIFDNGDEKENKADGATALIVVGAAAMLSSIPFTIMAGVNKRKANAMVASQKTGSGVVPPGVAKNITGITMTISIGK